MNKSFTEFIKSIAGYIAGTALIIFMDVRYLWIYYDLSEALIWTLFGAFILSLNFLYNMFKEKINDVDNKLTKHSNELEAIGNHLADLDNEKRENKLTPEKLKAMIKEI